MAKKLKVLIVEDDNFLLEMYVTKLKVEGFEVFSASDGEKGIKAVQEKLPDVILLDIMLPLVDGFGVLDQIKKDDKTKNIPVILLTNLSQKDDVKKGMAKGAADYLIKAHFMPAEVVEKIKKVTVK